MKKLFKNTSNLNWLILLCLIVGANSYAASPVARIDSIKGHVFYVSGGKTQELKKGDHIFDFSEIFTEVGSQVSFSDFYDHRYHMAGSGHLKIINKVVELGAGFLWFQSLGEQGEFYIQTPNAQVAYTKGEGIISFDHVAGKSQLLVIKGNFSFGNLLEQYLKLPVSEGKFSFISKDYERGAPRRPTPIGFGSYKKLTSLFQGVNPLDNSNGSQFRSRPTITPTRVVKTPKKPVVARSVASVDKNPIEAALAAKKTVAIQPVSPANQGKVLFIKKKETVVKSKSEEKLLNLYMNKISSIKAAKSPKKKWKRSYRKKSGVKVNVFGMGKAHQRKVSKRVPASVVTKKSFVTARGPASVGSMKPVIKEKSSAFENGLIKEYKNQMRHSNEMNQLIQELKSIDMDYQRNY